jgi:hypothetical protein
MMEDDDLNTVSFEVIAIKSMQFFVKYDKLLCSQFRMQFDPSKKEGTRKFYLQAQESKKSVCLIHSLLKVLNYFKGRVNQVLKGSYFIKCHLMKLFFWNRLKVWMFVLLPAMTLYVFKHGILAGNFLAEFSVVFTVSLLLSELNLKNGVMYKGKKIQTEEIFKGCSTIIFVLDAEENDFEHSLPKLIETLEAAYKLNPSIHFEVFLHKGIYWRIDFKSLIKILMMLFS